MNLDVKDGEFVSVVGPSGCGKSTLLKVVAGLLQPAAEAAYIDGEPVNGVPDQVGMVFQNDALLPWKTVAQNVRLPLAIKGLPDKAQEQEADRLLKMVGA